MPKINQFFSGLKVNYSWSNVNCELLITTFSTYYSLITTCHLSSSTHKPINPTIHYPLSTHNHLFPITHNYSLFLSSLITVTHKPITRHYLLFTSHFSLFIHLPSLKLFRILCKLFLCGFEGKYFFQAAKILFIPDTVIG